MIFVDTGFLFAIVSTKDEHHHRVLEVLKPYEDKRLSEFLLTTNHVVGETLTMLRGLGHQQAVRMGEQLYGEKLARVHWATREEELEAFSYLRRHDDKEYSFVDFESSDAATNSSAPLTGDERGVEAVFA